MLYLPGFQRLISCGHGLFIIILKHKNTERATIVIYYYIDKTYVTIVLYVDVQSQNMKIVHFNIIKLLTLAPAVKTNEKN